MDDFKGFEGIFAVRLRHLMEKNKTKQHELAKETNITRQAIGQYADGTVLPNIEKLYLIANYFNVSADYLLGANEDLISLKAEIKDLKKLHQATIDFYEKEIDDIFIENDINPNVSHPSHYTSHPSGIECIEITQHHDFCVGNAIKYLWRAGLKNEDAEIQDLEKAIFYIKHKINMLQEAKHV